MEVVDAQARQRGHQVFDRPDLVLALAEAGRQPGVGHRVRKRRQVGCTRQIRPVEHDAGIGRSRAQGHVDLVAGMQAHAGSPDLRL